MAQAVPKPASTARRESRFLAAASWPLAWAAAMGDASLGGSVGPPAADQQPAPAIAGAVSADWQVCALHSSPAGWQFHPYPTESPLLSILPGVVHASSVFCWGGGMAVSSASSSTRRVELGSSNGRSGWP